MEAGPRRGLPPIVAQVAPRTLYGIGYAGLGDTRVLGAHNRTENASATSVSLRPNS